MIDWELNVVLKIINYLILNYTLLPSHILFYILLTVYNTEIVNFKSLFYIIPTTPSIESKTFIIKLP